MQPAASIGVSCLRPGPFCIVRWTSRYNVHMHSTYLGPRPASLTRGWHPASSAQQHVVWVRIRGGWTRVVSPKSVEQDTTPAKDDCGCCINISRAGAFCSISESSWSKNRRKALSQARQVRMQAEGQPSRWYDASHEKVLAGADPPRLVEKVPPNYC